MSQGVGFFLRQAASPTPMPQRFHSMEAQVCAADSHTPGAAGSVPQPSPHPVNPCSHPSGPCLAAQGGSPAWGSPSVPPPRDSAAGSALTLDRVVALQSEGVVLDSTGTHQVELAQAAGSCKIAHVLEGRADGTPALVVGVIALHLHHIHCRPCGVTGHCSHPAALGHPQTPPAAPTGSVQPYPR